MPWVGFGEGFRALLPLLATHRLYPSYFSLFPFAQQQPVTANLEI